MVATGITLGPHHMSVQFLICKIFLPLSFLSPVMNCIKFACIYIYAYAYVGKRRHNPVVLFLVVLQNEAYVMLQSAFLTLKMCYTSDWQLSDILIGSWFSGPGSTCTNWSLVYLFPWWWPLLLLVFCILQSVYIFLIFFF